MSDLMITEQDRHLLNMATAGTAENSKRAYKGHILAYRQWLQDTGNGFNRTSVLLWRDHLLDAGYAKSTINQALTAVRRLAQELKHNGIKPGVMTGIIAVKSLPVNDKKAGTWLTADQVRCLFRQAGHEDHPLKEWQIKAGLVLLVGCALRRQEAAGITWSQFQKVGDHYVLLDVLGKGHKTRNVPVSPEMARILLTWQDMSRTSEQDIETDKIMLAVDRHGNLAGQRRTRAGNLSDGGMTGDAIYRLVKKIADSCGIEDLAPHDLRRTWARTAYLAGHDLKQISLIMGHESILTTENYLGLNDVDLDSPDFVSWGV